MRCEAAFCEIRDHDAVGIDLGGRELDRLFDLNIVHYKEFSRAKNFVIADRT